MNKLVQILSEIDGTPSFCIDVSGTILAASKTALEMFPDCIGQSLSALLPEFFPEKYPPDFTAYDYHHTLWARDGRRLDISRFDDILYCRLLPKSAGLWENLELPGTVREESLNRIRTSVKKTLGGNSSIEDVFSDLDLFDKNLYRNVTDALYVSNVNCRKICLACNRIEMESEFSADRFPPQRVPLTDALMDLVHDIRISLPGLHIQVREALPPYPITVQVNWELLQRVILEIIRHSAFAAQGRPGSTVLGIDLRETSTQCIIRLSDNYSGISTPDDRTGQVDYPKQIYRYIRRVMAYFGGDAAVTETDFGDNAIELTLPLLPDSHAVMFAVASPSDYVHASAFSGSYERLNLLPILIYLEEFADP